MAEEKDEKVQEKMLHMDEVVEKVLLRKGSSLSAIRHLKERTIETADRSEIGTLMRVNEYVVTAELARGSFGAVYLTEVNKPPTKEDPTPTCQCYAMKTFLKQKSQTLTRGPGRGRMGKSDDQNAVIRREITMMKRLNHPHIVSLLEV